jgi:hypothetical protein
VKPFDNLFGNPAQSANLPEGDLRHVLRRAQRLAGRGRQPAGVAGIRARAAEQTELAAEINDALRARDVVRAQALIAEGERLFGRAAMVDAVRLQARQAQEDRMAEHYPEPCDIEDGWLDDEPR